MIKKNIAGNGPHEAMASCLVLTKRHEAALAWTGRGIKRKETSQIYYLAGISWKNLQEPERAYRALKKSVALDANNEPAKKMLAEVELSLAPPNQDDTPEPEPLVDTETDECQQWKASIIANRTVCDQLLRNSYEDFFSCMDDGMTNSGYGPRSDEQTQMLHESCGVSSWTDEALAP